MNLTKTLNFSFACLVSALAIACSPSTDIGTDGLDNFCDYDVNDLDDWCYVNKDALNVDSVNRAYRADVYNTVQESGKYTTRDSVAAYLCKFDKLPNNYVSEDEGQKLYESKTGKTFEKWNFNPWTTIGVMIGGDKFDNYTSYNNYNYHKTLPEGSYHEADVEYSAKNRGTKRLIYQSNCVIYYTADHYETFSRLEIH